jgi:DUF4097 and DUF4098 domain-containing protein YvlB
MSSYSYRRGSIFWALTLIGVGAIFLYQNFNPNIHAWQIIAKFWPILIIFWGFSKLIDYVQAQSHPEAAAPPLFSSSEVILLILILVFGTMVSKIVLHSNWAGWHWNDDEFGNMFNNSYSYTATLTQPANPQPHLVVVDRRGDVEVRAADHSDIEAVVKETIRADSDDAAKKMSDRLKFSIVEQAGHYIFQSNLDSLPNSGSDVRLDITLRAPITASTEITSEHGDIRIDGLKGDQNLTASHGDVHVANVEGLVRIHKSGGDTEVRQVKGNVELDGHGQDVQVANVSGTVTVNGEYPGSVEFQDIGQTLRFTSTRTDMTAQKLSGRLSMEVGSLDASGLDGPFEISTKAKDISLEGFKHALKINDTTGDINLRAAVAPTHPISVESKKGDIELTLPAGSSFQIDATSHHGEVDTDFTGPGLKVTREGETPSITGTYGKGGPLIHLVTEYGTIHLSRQGTPASESGGRKMQTSLQPLAPAATPAVGMSSRPLAALEH